MWKPLTDYRLFSAARALRARYPRAALLALALSAFAIGYLASTSSRNTPAEKALGPGAAGGAVYVCPTMCIPPTARSGECPVCGMELIAVSGADEDGGPGRPRIRLAAEAVQLAGIQTAAVERRAVSAEVRAFGRVEYDPSQISYVSAFMPGVINRVYVERAGEAVRYGEPLFDLYSTELYFTQQELLETAKYAPGFLSFQSGIPLAERGAPVQAREQAKDTKEGRGLKRDAQQKISAIRRKLSMLGMSKKDIDELLQKGQANGIATVYAQLGGTVTEKKAYQGQFVNTGTTLFAIANPRYMWVRMDVYESDFSWVRNGQRITFETDAYPGETFSGKIVYIDPLFDPTTRTFSVGAIVPDTGGRLRAQMIARAVIHAELAAAQEGDKKLPLVVPDTAPLVTGTRAVVYVAVSGKDGVFEGREVKLGPRAKNYYVVKQGLAEGEQVVVNGSFNIDSAMQILARPSMINSIAGDRIAAEPTVKPPPAPVLQPGAPAAATPEGHYIQKGYTAAEKRMGSDGALDQRPPSPFKPGYRPPRPQNR